MFSVYFSKCEKRNLIGNFNSLSDAISEAQNSRDEDYELVGLITNYYVTDKVGNIVAVV